MPYKQSLNVLGDSTRREIFERLKDGPMSVGVLAERFPVSRPAVSQHLKALKDAGLVSETPVGTRRIYEIRKESLDELRAWLESFENTAARFSSEVVVTPAPHTFG
jgi:DNA-binding transcriptional ArsR family regulator